jgi:ATP synthase I subunit
MGGEFVARVSLVMLIGLAPFAACCGVVAGWPGAIGGLAGGLVSLGSFRWIASGVARASAVQGGGLLAFSALAVGVRHLVLFGALALALWSGVAHPVALIAGLSLLPPVILALGLSAARPSE